MKKKFDNANPVALITGGGKRLGREIAFALAQSGFDVVINYFKSERSAKSTINDLRSCGNSAVALKADITKPTDVKKMVSSVIQKYKRIDLLVNNAAVFYEGTLNTTTEDLWDKTIDINLKGAFFCAKEISRYMIRQKSGQIINISSIGGIRPFKNHIPYSVSKAGLIMLTKCLAKALAPHVLVNSISPGTINFREDKVTAKIKNEKTLLKKYADSKDITDLVVFFATRNKHITGQIVAVDGGSSII
jgi:NAD(P)-dependent dehydrogenase (short-subunit alcohol dehydrogenase family)